MVCLKEQKWDFGFTKPNPFRVVMLLYELIKLALYEPGDCANADPVKPENIK